MNTARTQFYVAMVANVGLVGLAALLVVCVAFGQQESEVLDNGLLLLLGGIINAAGAAAAYLFRLNGRASGGGGKPEVPPG